MLDTQLDTQLLAAPHYQRYPTLLPWVGTGYQGAELKILLLGESHYLDKSASFHHDADAWYRGLPIPAADLKWMNTRGVIQNGLKKRSQDHSPLSQAAIDASAAWNNSSISL